VSPRTRGSQQLIEAYGRGRVEVVVIVDGRELYFRLLFALLMRLDGRGA
jgi:hypothetical protein